MNTPSSALLHTRGARLKELIKLVSKWGHDRNIIQGSTAIKQLDKTSEEFNELQRALGQLDILYALEDRGLYVNDDLEVAYGDAIDAYGDILVTLIISAHMQGITLEHALNAAWLQIKDRRGELRNGKFVKESDL